LGTRLRASRRSAGLSQEELAERSGLSVRAISDLERGRTRWPYRDSLHRLADALGLRDAARAGFLGAAGRRLGRDGVPGRGDPAGGHPAGGHPAGGTGSGTGSGTAGPATAGPSTPGSSGPGSALDPGGPGGQDFTAPGGQDPGGSSAPGWAMPGRVTGGRHPAGRVIPRCLPATVPAFAGRRDQLAALSQVLNEPGGTAVVTAIGGTAGVGKTALAVHWAHQAAGYFPDGQLFVNLRGFAPDGAPVQPADAVRIFLDALQVPPDQLPQTVEAQLGLYRSLLAGRRMLVVLDNARDVAQVRPLLPGAPTCRAIVTSRNQLTGLAAIEGAHLLTLDVLTGPEARDLLRYRVGAPRADADPGAAAQIIRACAHLPLALSIIAARAAMRPDVPLGQVATGLRAQPGLDAFTAGGDPAADARAVFSWSYRQLSPAAARVFRLAGLHPGPDLERYSAAALAGLPPGRAGQLLETLASAGLLQPADPGRYGLHDLLRGYARELVAADPDGDRRAALTRLFGYYLHAAAAAMDLAFPAEQANHPPVPAAAAPAFTTAAQARSWLDAERRSLVAAAGQMTADGWPDEAMALSAILFRYLDVGAHYPEASAIHRCARRAAEVAGDLVGEANALNRLGGVALRQRRYEQAADWYEQALARSQDTGDQLGQANSHTDLGFIKFLQGRGQLAADHLERALALFRVVGDRAGEARALAHLGFADLRQGRYPQAVTHLRASLAVQAQAGDRGGEAFALGLLGETELRQGDYGPAAGHLRQSLDLWREFGERSNQADVLAMLGQIEFRQGRYPQALGYLEQAREVCQETGDRSAQATVLNHRGEVLLATGHPADARLQHTAALDLATQVGEKYEQARAHDGLGASYQASGSPGRAARHWQEAWTLYAALGAPEADLVRARLGQPASQPAG
jgi:tetratricopeptide (TPR) repeat protein